MVAMLMISANMAILGLLKIKVFWNKGYDIIISIHDVTNKFLSGIWPEKPHFLSGGLSASSIILDWH